MTTFEHLTTVRKEGIQASEGFFGQQVRERNPALFDNSSMWIKEAFELGLLYWGHNDVGEATRHFDLCVRTNQLRLEQYRLLRDIPAARNAFEEGSSEPEHLARLAGYFLGKHVERVLSGLEDESGYQPWFDLAFIDACVDGVPIDAAAFERSKKLWLQHRFPAAKLDEWDFYREVLEGAWSARDPDEMLQRHASLYAKRAKKKGMGDLIAGEGQFNPLVVDFIFAAILKRIGWKGEYRHAWPDNGVVPAPGARPVTTSKPSSFLTGSSATTFGTAFGSPAVGSVSEFLSALEARIPVTARRSRNDKENDEKAMQGLKVLGVAHDKELAGIISRYRLADLSSPRQNAGSLSDPAGMVEWTEYFRTHHGMSDALLLLTAPIEIADWEEPENAQFVYSIQDGRVYLADVEDLPDLSAVTARAQPGSSLWPSFGAFLLWYLGI